MSFPFENTTLNLEQTSNEIANDKQIQIIEEFPYFIEKYAGKNCALCNLGERSHLGQGEMLRLHTKDEQFSLIPLTPEGEKKLYYSNKNDSLNIQNNFKIVNKRQKGQNKIKCNNTSEHISELQKVGFSEALEFYNVIETSTFFYVHRQCIMWSNGVLKDSHGNLKNVAESVSKSLQQKCSFCNNYGANILCKMCPAHFHFPCVAASGGLQLIQNYVTFCKEHLTQASLTCMDANIMCRICSEQGDSTNLVMCCTCGDLFHGTCIGLPQLPDVRVGWHCKICNKCQICRLSDNSEGRSLSCEQCHKMYHANCLRPIMTSIPKYGWKCRFCRICSDCGSRTPGAGTSSRWHAHYTICDSCYQQRNKGFSCPICHRAYRAAAHKEMVKCNLCNKFVHSSCDSEADLKVYHAKKENNPDYDYICPPCSNHLQNGKINKYSNTKQLEEDISNSQDSNNYNEEGENDCFEKYSDNFVKGKPFLTIAVGKKRLGFGFVQSNRNRGKCSNQKRQRFQDCGRKRGPKTKIRTTFVYQDNQRAYNEHSNNKYDDEPGGENRLILCAAKDKFLLTQDICVMCGSIGTSQEGCLISCTQCGQCYHPYCVNVKITQVIIKKGWRCLDCTVCEGCGQKNDEARLILCDECDISFHIYCMEPPLEFVPQGHWKCKWCALCQKCGRSNSGINSLWKNSYSECGPCFSKMICPVCSLNYVLNDLLIKCSNCERWLHGSCDGIVDKEDININSLLNYNCILCRPKNLLKISNSSETSFLNKDSILKQTNECSNEQTSIETSHFVDGVFLSDLGFNAIKSLQIEYKKKRKPKYFAGIKFNNKSAGILAVIESVVTGDVCDKVMNETDDGTVYKDGMLWENLDETPPKGFSLCSNEEGVLKLKKKRQRNLQKLGIGGFVVRNRTLKKDLNIENNCNNSNQAKSSLQDLEKKRKPLKKKLKNRLSEIYPSYLQEAFFGKILLENEKSTFLESETTEDETKSDMSDDKVLNLVEEKVIGSMSHILEQNDEMISRNKNFTTCPLSIDVKNINKNAIEILDSKEKVPETEEKKNSLETFVNHEVFKEEDKKRSLKKKEEDLIKYTRENSGQKSFLYEDDFENIPKEIKLEHNLNSKLHINEEHIDLIPCLKFKGNLMVSDIVCNKKKIVEEECTSIAINSTSCSQKSSERMRKDEELGEMATISAVLYANTKHSSLKNDYPIWNDRCKQIYKRWRSLSNENKAPFLQQARDNRSTLRIKKVQHDQDRNATHQKAFKDQERERLWKLHQVMRAKEQQLHVVNSLKNSSVSANELNFFNPCETYEDIANLNGYTKKSLKFDTKEDTFANILNDQLTVLEDTDLPVKNSTIDSIKYCTNQRNSKQLRILLLKEKDNCSSSFSDGCSPLSGEFSPQHFLSDNIQKELLLKNKSRSYIKTEKGSMTLKKNKIINYEDLCHNKTKINSNSKKYLDKSEHEESSAIGEVGDILGGLVNDEDLLQSLTEEMGENFNILEYADPELNVLNDENDQHLFDKIDFHEENQNEKVKTCFYDCKILQKKSDASTTFSSNNFQSNQVPFNTKINSDPLKSLIPNKINCIVHNSDRILNENSCPSNKLKSPPPYPGPPPPYPVNEKTHNPENNVKCNSPLPKRAISFSKNYIIPPSSDQKQSLHKNIFGQILNQEFVFENKVNNIDSADQIVDRHISNLNIDSEIDDHCNKAELKKVTTINFESGKHSNTNLISNQKITAHSFKSMQSSNHGGGNIINNKDVIPILIHFENNQRIKLGLFGGSPMWNIPDITKHINSTNSIKQINNKKQIDNQTHENENQIDEYDDFNDKGIVATEVSLNSVAQNVTDNDDMAVIECFASSELADIVSSPLESEVAEEYVLFSSDVVDYTANEDCMRALTSQKSETTKTDVNLVNDLSSLKTDDLKSFNEQICNKHICTEVKTSTEVATNNILKNCKLSRNSSILNTKSSLPTDLYISSNNQKLTEVTQTTARVSIGNTTISVPLLKSVKINSNMKHILIADDIQKPARNVNKTASVLNFRETKIDSLSFKSHLNCNSKALQDSIISKSLKPQNKEVTLLDSTSKPNLIHNFGFPKFSQLSVLQDVSLPNNIFEDESSSPKSVSSAISVNSNEAEKFLDAKGNEFAETSTINESIKDININDDEESNKCKEFECSFTAVPQLSPLSQPTEMTTNLANVSQQLRSIMSSINISPSCIPNKGADDIKNLHNNLNSFENNKKNQFKKKKNESKIKKCSLHKIILDTTTHVSTKNGVKFDDVSQNMENTFTIGSTNLKRSKSTEEGIEKEIPAQISGTKRYSLEVAPKKVDVSEFNVESSIKLLHQSENEIFENHGTKVERLKSDDSQNVLLKQLLQNSAASNGSMSSQTINCRKVTSLRAPSLGMVSSLEAQLARPSLPPVSADAQVLLQKKHKYPIDSLNLDEHNSIKTEDHKFVQLITRETSFISNPQKKIYNKNNENIMVNNESFNTISNTEKKFDVTESKILPFNITYEARKLSSTKTFSKNLSSSAEIIPDKHLKKEVKPTESNLEIKKKKKSSKKTDCQKYKKYISSKDISNLNIKKRGRKYSKIDEDYDSFIDNLMIQFRVMPSLQVLEPLLNRSYNICPIFGSLDNSKTTTDSQCEYINQNIAMYFDYYNSNPFEQKNVADSSQDYLTQNGFYDFEFPRIITENHKSIFERIETTLENRELDTPDSYVVSSSPESFNYDYKNDVENLKNYNLSPTIPKYFPSSDELWSTNKTLKAYDLNSMYNLERKFLQIIPSNESKTRIMLTLTSSAAENILSVLQELACLLHIPSPNSYKIVEIEPIKKKYNFNFSKQIKKSIFKALIDIQSLVNGFGKFCCVCKKFIKNANQFIKIHDIDRALEKQLLVYSKKIYFCEKKCFNEFQQNHIKYNSVALNTNEICNESNLSSNNNTDNYIKRKQNHILKNNRQNPIFKVEYNYFQNEFLTHETKCKKPNENEIVELLLKTAVTVKPRSKLSEDTRQCILCSKTGDGISDGTSRLLNYDVNQWVHLNCALWSDGVYETVNGGLMNLEAAVNMSLNQNCSACKKVGATVKCFKNRCGYIFHLCCALKEKCVFYKNKTTFCYIHSQKNDKDNELYSLSVQRRVYVERDESRQVAAVMHQSDITNMLRVGSLIFLNVGQLLPHQLQYFHNQNFIYPIGYKIIRFYWSMRMPNKRCRYICSILDLRGRPEFRVLIQEPNEEDYELKGMTPISVWQTILDGIVALRKKHNLVQLFPKYITGEDLFGLTEPTVVRILESLPGIDTLIDYRFKYGRNPLLELPLAVNPSGAARTEAKQKQAFNWKKSYTQRTSSSTNQRFPLAPTVAIAGEVACPYSKQFVHSKSSQYKKMKLEWRNNVYLARSKIQGLGLYAARDLEKHTMVIEYIGEVIRTEVSEIREKQYEAKNRGIYMFRLDENRVVDATLSGGLARYINHSCNPNCVTEIVEVDREYRIIIFAKRRIVRGEELSYDYKFDIEEDANKISCMCGATSCKKWMN